MKLSKWIDKHAGYILIIPAVIFIILFSVAPILGSLRYAFFDMQLNDQSKNDMYLKSNVNLAMNQETIDYLRYYLDLDLDVIKKQDVKVKVEEINKDTKGLIFTNLVDTDMLYGHRNNIEGYARALEYFDSKLPEIMSKMKENDMLIITGDHGNDPSTPSTDHSREYTPILVYGKNIKENVNLGIRSTFADISATILDMLDLPKLENGISFRKEIEK